MIWLVSALIVAADQFSKFLTVRNFNLGEELYLFWGFRLTYVKNTGAAFGIFKGNTLPLGILSAIVALGIIIYLARNATKLASLQKWALVLILGGAIGNMIDRLRLGYVVDMIHFKIPSFDFAVFNVADSCVVIGAGLLFLASFLQRENNTATLSDEPQEALTSN